MEALSFELDDFLQRGAAAVEDTAVQLQVEIAGPVTPPELVDFRLAVADSQEEIEEESDDSAWVND